MNLRTAKLGEVIKHRKGFIIIDDDKEYKLCRVQVNRRGVVLREIIKGSQIKTKKQQVCKAGDFLVAEMDAKVGGYGFVPQELDGAIVSSHYFLFEIDETKIRPKYLEVVSQLLILQDQIKAVGSTNYAAIRPANVLNWNIPITDIEHQIKIEQLFDTTTAEGTKLITELTLQQDLVKKLRQAYLCDATQGKLVSQNSNDEPASELLKKIMAEKNRLIIEKKVKLGKLQEAEMQDELLFEIPDNWEWCKLDDLCFNITDGTHQTPIYTAHGRPFLSAQHVKPFKFSPDNKKFVSEEAYLECIKNKKPERGDILVTRVGAIGEAAIIDQDIEFAFYVSLGLIQPFKSYVSSKYLELVINSPYGNLYSKGNVSSKGSSAGNFNLGRIRSFLIPLPPLAEQERIVHKVDQLMQLCDALQQSITQSKQQTDMLLQQVLREALQPKSIIRQATVSKVKTSKVSKVKVIKLPVLQELEDNYFLKRKVLATHIINQSLTDQKFGDVKFEKLLHLSDYFATKRNFGQKYYQKAAGPYDNAFTIPYFKQVIQGQWFNRTTRGQQYVFTPGKNHNKSTNTYGFFNDDELAKVNQIIAYFKKADYEQPEIISTLYAVWNNRIIRQQEITDALLISDFYDWDDNKKKYENKRLQIALQWMKEKDIIPDGWGKLIEKPKKRIGKTK